MVCMDKVRSGGDWIMKGRLERQPKVDTRKGWVHGCGGWGAKCQI